MRAYLIAGTIPCPSSTRGFDCGSSEACAKSGNIVSATQGLKAMKVSLCPQVRQGPGKAKNSFTSAGIDCRRSTVKEATEIQKRRDDNYTLPSFPRSWWTEGCLTVILAGLVYFHWTKKQRKTHNSRVPQISRFKTSRVPKELMNLGPNR